MLFSRDIFWDKVVIFPKIAEILLAALNWKFNLFIKMLIHTTLKTSFVWKLCYVIMNSFIMVQEKKSIIFLQFSFAIWLIALANDFFFVISQKILKVATSQPCCLQTPDLAFLEILAKMFIWRFFSKSQWQGISRKYFLTHCMKY